LSKPQTDNSWQWMDANGQSMAPQELPAARALTERKTVKTEELGLTKSDKTVVWLNVTASPIPLRGYGVVLTYLDVTQNRQERLSMMASEARYRLLFENTRYAVLRTTPEWKVLEANAEACRLFGYSEEAIKLVEQRRLLDMADTKLRASLEEGKRTGKCREEITLTKADGTPFKAELNIKSLTYDSNHQEFAITIKPAK
jgi:PAS domain S-box-containing protein